MSFEERFEPVGGMRDRAGLVALGGGAAVIGVGQPVSLLAGACWRTQLVLTAAGAGACLLGAGLREGTRAGQWGLGALSLAFAVLAVVLVGRTDEVARAVGVELGGLFFGLGGAFVLAGRDPVLTGPGVGGFGAGGGGLGGDGGGGGGC